ncbi:hypothetical protein SCREM2_gp49 [Synechococcus phage S-CREM2]|nr:hypothetical protein SCREM2_gp49 [Synechococcus phage S-CREM2]
MTPDERWYEAVKHLKKAQDLLDGKLIESRVITKNSELSKFTLVFNEKVLEVDKDGDA